jgi:hypothetical protein
LSEPAASRTAADSRPLARRLVTNDGRLLEWRPAVVAAGLLARVVHLRAHALWPDVERPLLIVDVGSPRAAAWTRTTFAATGRKGRFPAPATWDALRARALLIGDGGVAVTAAERGLARTLQRPRLAIYSPTGAPDSKATCFVFERRLSDPSVVVKLMADPRFESRLRWETENVETLRARLAGHRELVEALPLRPLYAGEVGNDYVVVQDPDPLAPATGRVERGTALAWLAAFHQATEHVRTPWDAKDDEREVEHTRDGWLQARREQAEAVAARVAQLLAPLRGVTAPRCATHGDFWRGNVASDGNTIRVYDWEWVERDGRPFFDLWLYELGELRERALSIGDLEQEVAQAVRRVERELAARALDPRFALATLAGSLALITFRERLATGLPGSGEEGSLRVMEAAEQLLLRTDRTAG